MIGRIRTNAIKLLAGVALSAAIAVAGVHWKATDAVLATFPFPLIPGSVQTTSSPAVIFTEEGRGTGTSVTVSNCYIGTPASDRIVVVCVAHQNSATRTINDVTVGGVSCTQQVIARAGAQSFNTSIWTLNVTSGTNADVVVTCTNGATHITCNVLIVYGGTIQTTAVNTGLVTTALSTNVSVGANSYILASYQCAEAGVVTAFSGTTTSINSVSHETGTGLQRVGFQEQATATTATVEMAAGTSSNQQCMAIIVFTCASPIKTYRQELNSTATYSFTDSISVSQAVGSGGGTIKAGAAIGTAAADRYIIVTYGWRVSGASRTLSAVKVGGSGGTALTRLFRYTNGSATWNLEVWGGLVTSGTTADIWVQASASSIQYHGMAIYACYGLYDGQWSSPVPMCSRFSANTNAVLPVGTGFALAAAMASTNTTVTIGGGSMAADVSSAQLSTVFTFSASSQSTSGMGEIGVTISGAVNFNANSWI